MKSDYAAFCPVVNRPDLFTNVLVSLPSEVKDELIVIDNSIDAEFGIMFPATHVHREMVPLSFSQSMNVEFEYTISRGKPFMVHMHSDAIIPEGAIEKLLHFARGVELEGRKWAVIYTFYDILAAYNPAAYQAIGGYDTTLPAYFSDQDWYHRCDLAGWERIDTGISVGHVGSATINSDPFLKSHNSITFPLYRQYYIAKWGGEPGHERFQTPFNNFSQNRILVGRKG